MWRDQEWPSIATYPLTSNNPFPKGNCDREQCPYLRSGKSCLEKCSKENVGYRAECLKCEEKQKAEGAEVIVKRVYFGETSRTLKHRSSQHISDHKRTVLRKGTSTQTQDPSPSSWIADHAEESHGGLTGLDPDRDIKFIKGKTHRDPLSRLIEEATLINWGLERGLEIGANKDP